MYLAKVNQRVFKRSCCFYFAVRASLGFFPPCIGVTSTEQRGDVLINLTNFQRTCWGNEGRSRRDSSLKNVQGKERGRESDLHFSRGEATRLDPAVFHCPELNVGLTTSTWSTFRWPDIIIYDREERFWICRTLRLDLERGPETREEKNDEKWESRPVEGKNTHDYLREINALWRTPRTRTRVSFCFVIYRWILYNGTMRTCTRFIVKIWWLVLENDTPQLLSFPFSV